MILLETIVSVSYDITIKCLSEPPKQCTFISQLADLDSFEGREVFQTQLWLLFLVKLSNKGEEGGWVAPAPLASKFINGYILMF